MSLGKTIDSLPLAETVIGGMLIPTGGFGDKAVTLDQLKAFVQASYVPYFTTSPSIKVGNGKLQRLTLMNSGKLTCDFSSGQYVFIKVRGQFDLDISDFKNITPHRPDQPIISRDPRYETTILIFNFLGEKLLFLSNYIPSSNENPDPVKPVANANSIKILTGTNTSEAYIPQESVRLTINGVVYTQPPAFLTFEPIDPPYPHEPPLGYAWIGYGLMSNTSGDDLDVIWEAQPTNQTQIKSEMFDNDSVVSLGNDSFRFTLKAHP